MYRGNSNPSLRNTDREDDRDTVFSGMSNEGKHALPPLPASEDGHENHGGRSPGSGTHNVNSAGLGAGTPLALPPSISRAQPQMAQAPDSQRVSVAGQSTLASGSTPPLPPQPVLIRSRTANSRPFSDVTRVLPRAPHSDSSSLEKSPLDDHPVSPSGRELELGLHQVSPVQINLAMPEGNDDGSGQDRERGIRPNVTRSRTGLDWIIPQGLPAPSRPPGPKTVGERLRPTIEHAQKEEAKCNRKAQMTGYALNIAIGLQVVISALITGLSAVTTGKNTSIMTSILGGCGTIVASYLARARGSNEPELSISRVKDLQRFIRDCEAFVEDHGHEMGEQHNKRVEEIREEFEHLLGNGNGERRLSNINNV